ncbi:hypothetical protein BDC45DRAFT_576552 [Circinella umbellata]|nr:hypothetical protein BDC45DRAFT_576552 [Circinella umbellata]
MANASNRPLTKEQKHAREQLKNLTDGHFQKLAHTEENIITKVSNNSEMPVEDDFEILAALEVEEAPEVNDEGIEEAGVKKNKGSHEITDFFKEEVDTINGDDDNHDNHEIMTIQEAYDQLTPIVVPSMNIKKDTKRGMADYELKVYFGELLKKTPIMKAS